jgi:ABC-type cobalamin/Fe3+-siderophores transport system ATPase subunit
MLLLLGPPGAGKTTLLELLAGRKPNNKKSIIQGQIQVDGKDWTDDFNRVAGYVTQEDVHFRMSQPRCSLERERERARACVAQPSAVTNARTSAFICFSDHDCSRNIDIQQCPS